MMNSTSGALLKCMIVSDHGLDRLEQSPLGRSCRDNPWELHPSSSTQKLLITNEGQWQACERCSTAWFYTNEELRRLNSPTD